MTDCENIKCEIEEYMLSRRDTKREQKLLQQVRRLPEDQRFQLVQECLPQHISFGLRLANSCLQKPVYFQWILEQGLQQADASSIRTWLDCVTPHLGFRRVIAILMHTWETNPRAVEKSLYWLPIFLPRDDERAVESWLALRTLAEPKDLVTAAMR